MTEGIFWLSAAVLLYSFFGYGLLLVLISRAKPPRPEPPAWAPPRVSFLIAAHNEADVIAEKLRNTLALGTGGAAIEVVLVSDGSTDATAEIARSFDDPRITVLELGRVGKSAALGAGLEHCTGTVVVFSDANAILADGTAQALLRHFANPDVGGVCGQISVESAGGRKAGLGFSEGLFWRYDQALKHAESRLGGTVSAQGSVYALRYDLVSIPGSAYADDFMISVGVVDAGLRLVFEPQARAAEIVTESAGNEMRRRVRSAELSWRSLMHAAHLMNPFQYGWYAWQLTSHKLIRRLNPLFLVLLFVSNLALIGQNWFFALTGLGQIAFYAIAVAALIRPSLRRFRIASIASFFLLAHVALAQGFLRYVTGRKSVTWTPSREGS